MAKNALSWKELLAYKTYYCKEDECNSERCMGEHEPDSTLRRNPVENNKLLYQSSLCKQEGNCTKGAECDHAHTTDESTFHPSTYLQMACTIDHPESYDDICPNYHNENEEDHGKNILQIMKEKIVSQSKPFSPNDVLCVRDSEDEDQEDNEHQSESEIKENPTETDQTTENNNEEEEEDIEMCDAGQTDDSANPENSLVDGTHSETTEKEETNEEINEETKDETEEETKDETTEETKEDVDVEMEECEDKNTQVDENEINSEDQNEITEVEMKETENTENEEETDRNHVQENISEENDDDDNTNTSENDAYEPSQEITKENTSDNSPTTNQETNQPNNNKTTEITIDEEDDSEDIILVSNSDSKNQNQNQQDNQKPKISSSVPVASSSKLPKPDVHVNQNKNQAAGNSNAELTPPQTYYNRLLKLSPKELDKFLTSTSQNLKGNDKVRFTLAADEMGYFLHRKLDTIERSLTDNDLRILKDNLFLIYKHTKAGSMTITKAKRIFRVKLKQKLFPFCS